MIIVPVFLKEAEYYKHAIKSFLQYFSCNINPRVGTMATKFKSLLTDDKYEISESDAE